MITPQLPSRSTRDSFSTPQRPILKHVAAVVRWLSASVFLGALENYSVGNSCLLRCQPACDPGYSGDSYDTKWCRRTKLIRITSVWNFTKTNVIHTLMMVMFLLHQRLDWNFSSPFSVRFLFLGLLCRTANTKSFLRSVPDEISVNSQITQVRHFSAVDC